MALLKEGYKNGAGVESKYWKIIDYRVNSIMKYVDITFGGWLNEECKTAEMDLSDTPRKVRCTRTDFDAYFSIEVLDAVGVNQVSQMYKFAKDKSDFFLGATDLI